MTTTRPEFTNRRSVNPPNFPRKWFLFHFYRCRDLVSGYDQIPQQQWDVLNPWNTPGFYSYNHIEHHDHLMSRPYFLPILQMRNGSFYSLVTPRSQTYQLGDPECKSQSNCPQISVLNRWNKLRPMLDFALWFTSGRRFQPKLVWPQCSWSLLLPVKN